MRKKINYKTYPVDNSRYIYVPTKQNKQVVHRILKTPKYKKQDAIFKSTNLSNIKNLESDLNLDEVVAKKELKEKLSKALSHLTPREERVIRMRFGIGLNTDHTLDEVGQQFSVTDNRIMQIEGKALRKLRELSKSNNLKDYLNVA
jgi:RNA polymerase sigma factor (sigma-70 family)